MSKIKVALLSGGISSEREISIKTGDEIYKALDKNKYEIIRFDPKTDIKQFFDLILAKKIDIVFPALHGPFGEDGKLQGMLDLLHIPYLFSGTLASALSMHKYKTKVIVNNINIKIIPDMILNRGDHYNIVGIMQKLSVPIVVKPMELGSSVGMNIVNNEKELEEGIKVAFKHGSEILLEKFVKGKELTVGVMGNNPPKALPVIEIIPKASSWYDYKAKYENGGSEHICPAKINDDLREKIQSQAIMAYRVIGCKDLARVDFIYEPKNAELYFMEINTIPGMTSVSLAPEAAKAAGLNFSEFLDILIQGALNK